MVAFWANAAAFANFHSHCAGDHVTRRKVFHTRRVALHEPLTAGIGEVTALPACAFSDQAAGTINARGVELDEFHILQRQACTQHHGVAVAGAGVGRGAGEIGPAVTAGGEHGLLGAEPMQCAIVELPGCDAATRAFVVHDKV